MSVISADSFLVQKQQPWEHNSDEIKTKVNSQISSGNHLILEGVLVANYFGLFLKKPDIHIRLIRTGNPGTVEQQPNYDSY